jgi:Holliday junction resolvase
MSAASHCRKGAAHEREIVNRHRALGVHAERYPLSGASRFRPPDTMLMFIYLAARKPR